MPKRILQVPIVHNRDNRPTVRTIVKAVCESVRAFQWEREPGEYTFVLSSRWKLTAEEADKVALSLNKNDGTLRRRLNATHISTMLSDDGRPSSGSRLKIIVKINQPLPPSTVEST